MPLCDSVEYPFLLLVYCGDQTLSRIDLGSLNDTECEKFQAKIKNRYHYHEADDNLETPAGCFRIADVDVFPREPEASENRQQQNEVLPTQSSEKGFIIHFFCRKMLQFAI